MDTFNVMSKGLKDCYVHNIDTFNAMSKGLKDYVKLKQRTYTSLCCHQMLCMSKHAEGSKLFDL